MTRRSAVLHASWNMKTRELPAYEDYQDRFDDTEAHRTQKNNAFKWTKAVNEDLRRAKQPIIVSVGWDGWTCNTERLPQWLEKMPDARWFFRLTGLQYKPDPSLLRKDHNLYWAEFDSTLIAQGLRDALQRTPELAQLLRIWDHIQTQKDNRVNEDALLTGRNLLLADDEATDISTDEDT